MLNWKEEQMMLETAYDEESNVKEWNIFIARYYEPHKDDVYVKNHKCKLSGLLIDVTVEPASLTAKTYDEWVFTVHLRNMLTESCGIGYMSTIFDNVDDAKEAAESYIKNKKYKELIFV